MRMFFTYNQLAVIFGHVGAGQGQTWLQDITNSKNIAGKQYKMPTAEEFLSLIETPNSGRATVNYYPASFAAVKVDLSGDATYGSRGWANNTTNASYIYGYLFFPDNAFILDAKIQVASLNGRWGVTVSNLTADDIRNYTVHGCMFLPAVGLASTNMSTNRIIWEQRGMAGRAWTGCLSAIPTDQADPSFAARFRFDSQMLRVAAYGRYDLIPVVLIEQ